MGSSKPLLMLSVILGSIFLLGNVNAQEDVIKNVIIAYGASNVENDRFYSPSTITVEPGTTIRWLNVDDDPHTATDGTTSSKWGEVFDSGLLRKGRAYTYTFTEPGTYPYLCALHPWMFGKVVVEDPRNTIEVKVLQKLSVLIRSEQQTYSEGETVRFEVEILGAGNKPADPDTIDAWLSLVNGEEPKPADLERLDVGKYSVSITGLEPESYNLSIRAAKDGFESGYSMLTVYVVGNEDADAADTDTESPPTTVHLESEKSRYSTGDSVTIHGEVKPVQLSSVVLQVLDSENRLYARGQAELQLDGSFAWTFRVAESATEGKWTVKADYMDGSATVSVVIARPSVVTEPEPVLEPAVRDPTPIIIYENEKVTIANSIITDQKRTQLSVASVGQQVVVQTGIRNNEDRQQAFTFLMQVKDSSGSVVRLETIEGTLPAAKSFSVGMGWTPETEGIFSAEVFVWKSLLEPVPLSLNPQKIDVIVQG